MIEGGLQRARRFTEKMLFSCFGVTGQTVGLGRRREEEEGGQPRMKKKVVVVGDGECGKTCLLQRFSRDTYNAYGYLPTVIDTDVIDVELEHATVELMVCDTAGQEDYDRLRPYAYADADAVVVVFALDAPDSLDSVARTWVPEVRHFCGPHVPVLLAGTKMDMRLQGEPLSDRSGDECSVSSEDFLDFPGRLPSASLIKQGPVKASAAKRVAAEVGAEGYWETSALLDMGVTELFRAVTKATASSKRKAASRGASGTIRKTSFLERIGAKRKS